MDTSVKCHLRKGRDVDTVDPPADMALLYLKR